MSVVATFTRNLSLTSEEAYELAYSLANMEKEEFNGCTIFSGTHIEYGNIHVIIPHVGETAAILHPFEVKPVVLQSF